MFIRDLLLTFIFCTFSSFLFGQTLHLTTENYPPFNLSADASDSAKEAKITGISTKIVQELFRRTKTSYTLKLYPWQRAYWLAQNKQNYGVFSTTRTPAREKLFKWVGPLVENDWAFFAKKEKKIKLRSLEDAKKYRVGGYEGDALALYLKSEGFKLNLAIADHYNALLIFKDRIDIWATGRRSGPYLAKQEGVRGLEEVFIFKKTVMYIAFNKSVSNTIIDTLNKALQKMRNDGTIEAIYKRYR
ncbi:MAG: polar amino acid transport system substrate-binding protein [bacterium]|jgi:polar amino acid transport system substrate-binding protein